MINLKKKIIVRIAEGIGNQLFMYANAYSLSKKYDYELEIDDTSGYFKKKNKIRSYELHNFQIENKLTNHYFKFDSYKKDLKRKMLKKFDFFKKYKKFIIEKKDSNKNTFFSEISLDSSPNIIFIEGHYECENYFKDYKNDIRKIFKVKPSKIEINNTYINDIRSSNSISICIRQNRFSEGKFKNNFKSRQFTNDTIDYIYKSIEYIKKYVEKPKFFIWSNDLTGLDNYFDKDKYVFIDNKRNKALTDFYLFNYCKHFIVGPSSFHWWGAWLNENPDKICIRPSKINPSKNKNFWPNKWISI